MKCKNCGTYITNQSKDGLCLKCRSEKINDVCKINKFGYKQGSIPIPYCFEKDKLIIQKNFKWLCGDCEYRKRRIKMIKKIRGQPYEVYCPECGKFIDIIDERCLMFFTPGECEKEILRQHYKECKYKNKEGY